MCAQSQSCLTLCNPMDCSPPGFSVHGDSPGKNTGVGCHACPLPGDLPNPRIEPRSLALQVDSLPSEPPGKPKNTGVGSLVPSPGNHPDPEIEPALQADFLPAKLPRKPCGNPYNVLGSFYWTIVALQSCVSFYCTKGISYMYTYIRSFLD